MCIRDSLERAPSIYYRLGYAVLLGIVHRMLPLALCWCIARHSEGIPAIVGGRLPRSRLQGRGGADLRFRTASADDLRFARYSVLIWSVNSHARSSRCANWTGVKQVPRKQ